MRKKAHFRIPNSIEVWNGGCWLWAGWRARTWRWLSEGGVGGWEGCVHASRLGSALIMAVASMK